MNEQIATSFIVFTPRNDVEKQSVSFSYFYSMNKSYVYFMTNKNNSVIYIGVTSNLIKRVYQHKTKTYKGFTFKYNCDKLIYFEEFNEIKQAIDRGKLLKSGNRKRKEELINSMNPNGRIYLKVGFII